MCKYKDVNLEIKKFDFNVKLSEMRRAAMLLIVMMITAMTAWAASAFSVENINGSTFRISRTGNTTVSETIDWRVVSLSAIAGVHFTGYQGNYSGTVTFNAMDTYVDVPISELTPGNNAYSYQNGNNRSYRFEVLDRNGDILASCDRTKTTGINVPSSGLFSEKEITIYTDPEQYSDAGYDKGKNPHAISSAKFYSLGGIAPAAYYTLIGAQLRSTLSIDAAEKNNGYQYVQILINNIQTCDNRSKCDNGDPGNMNISLYMAGFDHQPSSTNTSYAAYTFPVTSQPNNCSTVDNAWNNGVPNKLYTQKFNTNCRATDGRLILPFDFEWLVVRFNASGGGTDHDEWYAKNVKAYIQAVDGSAPYVLNNYKVSGGRHQKGNTIYVSVAFSEIVVVTDTPTLSSNWGTLSYTSGSGSNVLTFQGTIDPSDNNPFNVTGYSGTIKDLAGIQLNTASSTISHNFGTTLDADYVWSASDFNSLDGSSYEIATKTDLRHLALLVNGKYSNCSGLTFRQTHDITYNHTTNWNNSSSTEDNYTAIGYHKSLASEAPFRGTFDGQGHTISGIRIYKDGNTSADDSQGLFGCIGQGGTVRGVNLADARITGKNNVGGIAGRTYYATVEDCSVSADVCIHAVQNNSDYHGGIVGYSQGTVQRCLSRATLTVADNASGCGSYGAIVGMNDKHTVMDCIAYGATVPNVFTAVSSIKPSVSSAGAIIGENISENKIGSTYVIQRNYYRACTVAGTENATGVGIGYDHSIGGSVPIDISANQSAQVLKYSLTLTSGVTLERSPSATLPGTGNATYTTGADIDGTPYAIPNTQRLHLAYSGEVPVGYHVIYSVNGSDISGNSFTMPTNNVEVTATVTLQPVAYIDADGTEQSCTDYTLLDSNDDISNAMVQGNLPGGWYVVDGVINCDYLQFSGDVHIILADGARLDVNSGIYSEYDLAIYGQAAGSGELSVSNDGTSIYCNNICINGGTINIESINNYGILATGNVTINGGTINIVSSNNYGIQANGNVTINGGTIYISGSHYSQINASNVILGTSTSLKTLNITNDIAVNTISLDRTFTKGKPATVMLPFSMDVNDISGGTFYTFGGVEKENDKWVATMNAVTGSIEANTPYLVMPTETSLTFNNGTHLCTEGGGGGQTADEGSHWTFKGTYDYIKWTTDTSDPDYNAERAAEIGSAYGFAGVAKDDIEVGDFVKVASGAKIRPMSCYLLWNNTPNAANARALSSSAAATDEELPSRITVRLVGADGEVTGIGEVDAQTGEMDFDSEAWYTPDGVRLSSKPSKKGLYINNGKRVVIK